MAIVLNTEDYVNTELLIQEVKKRPALYDDTLKEYTDQDLKKKLWEEVCENVFSSVWGDLSAEDKRKSGKLMFRRWRSLKAGIKRSLTEQKINPPPRAKYKFHDELLFLEPFMKVGLNIRSKPAADRGTRHDNTKEADRPPVRKMKKKSKKERYSKYLPQRLQTVNDVNHEQNFVEIFPVPNEGDLNSAHADKHFALSLTPMLKALPPYLKIEAQIQILQVFRNLLHNVPPPGMYDQFGYSGPSNYAVYPPFPLPQPSIRNSSDSLPQPSISRNSFPSYSLPQPNIRNSYPTDSLPQPNRNSLISNSLPQPNISINSHASDSVGASEFPVIKIE